MYIYKISFFTIHSGISKFINFFNSIGMVFCAIIIGIDRYGIVVSRSI